MQGIFSWIAFMRSQFLPEKDMNTPEIPKAGFLPARIQKMHPTARRKTMMA
jgi:hypothetical protein